MQRKALESGTSRYRDLVGESERGSFTGEFVGWTKQDYGSGESPIWELCEGKLVTAGQDLDIPTRYLTETERTSPTFKWEYYLAHIVIFFSVWIVMKLIKHVRDM